MRILFYEVDEYIQKEIKEIIEELNTEDEIIYDKFYHLDEFKKCINIFEYHLAFVTIDTNKRIIPICEYLTSNQPDCYFIALGKDYDCLQNAFYLRSRQLILKGKEYLIQEECLKFIQEYKQKRYQVLLHTKDNGDIYLNPRDILYIHHNKNIIQIKTIDNEYTGTLDNLIETKENLSPHYFYQVHRFYFVNVDHILLFKRGSIQMDNGDFIPTTVFNYHIIREIKRIHHK